MSKMVMGGAGLAGLKDLIGTLGTFDNSWNMGDTWSTLANTSGETSHYELDELKSTQFVIHGPTEVESAHATSIHWVFKGSGFSVSNLDSDNPTLNGTISEIQFYQGGTFNQGSGSTPGSMSGATLIGDLTGSTSQLQFTSGNGRLTLGGAFTTKPADILALGQGTYSGSPISITSIKVERDTSSTSTPSWTEKAYLSLAATQLALTVDDIHTRVVLTGTNFPTSLSAGDIKKLMAGTWEPTMPMVSKIEVFDTKSTSSTADDVTVYSVSDLNITMKQAISSLEVSGGKNPFAGMFSGGGNTLDDSSATDGIIFADGRMKTGTFDSAMLGNGSFSTIKGGSGNDFISGMAWKVQGAISLDSKGAWGGGESSQLTISGKDPAVGGNGQFIAFASKSANLVDGDTNKKQDIFLKNLKTGSLQRVSVAGSGSGLVQANGGSRDPSISGNGRYVVFESDATNLTGSSINDSNSAPDIFLRDTTNNITTCISLTTAGTATGNGASGSKSASGAGGNARISADGAYVAFASDASNLISSDTNGVTDIFVRNIGGTPVTTRVSVATNGDEANGASTSAKISSDGRYILFDSMASNLVDGDTNGYQDVFVRDTLNNTTTRVDVSTAGDQTNENSKNFQISDDGRFILFGSFASDLVGDDSNGVADLFVRDTVNNTTIRVDVASDGSEADGACHADFARMSRDGRFVLFASDATNLVPSDQYESLLNSDLDHDHGATHTLYYLRDLLLNTTTILPFDATAVPVISADGETITFLASPHWANDPTTATGTDYETIQVYVATRSSPTTLQGGGGADTLMGAMGGDTLDGGTGADTLSGDRGDDIYIVDNTGDIVIENSSCGTDLVKSSVSYALPDNVENITLTGSDNINAKGNGMVNTLTGNDGNNTLDGCSGGDALIGGKGNDTYVIYGSGDVITEKSGEGTDTVQCAFSYTLGSNLENLVLKGSGNFSGVGNDGANTLTGNSGGNTLDGKGGADRMQGGSGDDLYIVDNSGDTIVENSGEGTDLVQSSVSYGLAANVENLTLTGTGDLNGTGNGLSNTLTGTDGKNTLDGGAGSDTLIGGKGDDLYLVDDTTGDVIIENSSGGTDSVRSSVNYSLSANVENLTLTGSALRGTGNSAANTLTGTDGDNTLDGGAGADALIGGKGNDTYIVDNSGDTITEKSGEGTDWVQTAFSAYTLGANLENLTLTIGGVTGVGNDVANTLTGNSGDNTLDGKGGADSMIGGDGNDTYLVDNSGDLISENSGDGSGIDTVKSTISYSLMANLENLVLLGSGNLNGTGNSAANTLTGTDGNNTLDGGTGVDALIGGKGDDVYLVDDSGDTISENSGGGTDLVKSVVSYTLAANVENLTLLGSVVSGVGNDQANTLTGNSAANTLDGKGGADTLIGGAGDDLYIVDNSGDVVIEASGSGSGTDLIQSSVSYTLSANVENLTLTGSALSGTGNDLANTLTGNSGNNTLDGKGGIDILIGGAGDDTYIVDGSGDIITENSGEGSGTDTVRSSVNYSLGDNLENLVLTGSGNLSGIGNGLNNTLTGTDGNNTLDGGIGADTLLGGKGNDLYFVNNSGDVITEKSGEGTDSVQSSVNYTLSANVENLTLTTGDLNGFGSSDANTLTGTTGNNTLDGKGGADTLIGLAGDDTYGVDNTGDIIIEGSGGGIDLVLSSVSYTLVANVENLTLTTGDINGFGNSDVNTLTGSSGKNTLDGKGGADCLIGGAGDDTYIVDNSGDTITENSGEGTDLVKSSVTYSLAANVENLTLTATGALNGTGNILANTLTGGDGDNVLNDGGVGGNDTLIGGKGNDTYVVNNTGDVVTEKGGEGTDLIQSSVTYTLSANVENLTLTGSGVINGIGNDLANTLTGNIAANTLDGKGGADTLIGGGGDDTYVVDNTGDVVTELSGGGTDWVLSSVTYTLSANVENLTLTGTGDINGYGNSDVNTITGTSGKNSLDGKGGADTLIGGAGDDVYIVGDSGVKITENSGEGTDWVKSSVTYTLSANVENLTITGYDAVNGIGNSSANTIIGNNKANTLQGGGGADTLTGGAFNDTFLYMDPSEGGDTITDFSHTDDKIMFYSPNFGGILTVNKDNFESNSTGTASSSTARFIFNTKDGKLYYDNDGNASLASTLIATLKGVTSLVATDLQMLSS